jgi:hypothetical protein
MFDDKRVAVRRKIEAIHATFDRFVKPDLLKARLR